VAEIENRSESC